MNFQVAMNNPGKFEKMQGTVNKFDVKTGEYGDYALGEITDNENCTKKVFFAASDDSPLPDKATCFNKLGIWAVRYDANTQRIKVYFNGLVAQQLQPQATQQAPPQTAQGQQQPAQQPNPALPLPESGKQARALAIDIAARLVAGGKHATVELYGLADFIVDYIQTGKHPTGIAGVQEQNSDFPEETS